VEADKNDRKGKGRRESVEDNVELVVEDNSGDERLSDRQKSSLFLIWPTKKTGGHRQPSIVKTPLVLQANK
jgi:hypothetical protein